MAEGLRAHTGYVLKEQMCVGRRGGGGGGETQEMERMIRYRRTKLMMRWTFFLFSFLAGFDAVLSECICCRCCQTDVQIMV